MNLTVAQVTRELEFFQSQKRESDISMVTTLYASNTYLGNDFIGPVISYDFHFLSGAPHTRNNFLTIFRPFDPYVWGFLLASIVVVSISLIYINKVYNSLSSESVKETPFQSM